MHDLCQVLRARITFDERRQRPRIVDPVRDPSTAQLRGKGQVSTDSCEEFEFADALLAREAEPPEKGLRAVRFRVEPAGRNLLTGHIVCRHEENDAEPRGASEVER